MFSCEMQSNSPLLTQPESFNNFLLEKPFSLSLYRTDLIIAGLSLPLFFGFYFLGELLLLKAPS